MTIATKSAWIWIVSVALLALPVRAEVLNLQGDMAIASFKSVDASGCIVTSATVTALPGRNQGSGGETTDRANLTILKWRQCGGYEELFAGSVTVPALPDGALRTLGHLSFASLEYSFELVDAVSGGVWTVPVSLIWDGREEILRSTFRDELHSQSFHFLRWSVGTHRTAPVTGSILLDGQELVVHPASHEELFSNRSGRLTVNRQ